MDEAHFSLIRNLISKNCTPWDDENLHAMHHRVYRKLKEQCRTFALGPYIFLGCYFQRRKNGVYHKCSVHKKVSELRNFRIKAVVNDICMDAGWCCYTRRHICSKCVARAFWWWKYCSFVATTILRPYSNFFLVLELSEILSVHIVSNKFFRIERYHKTVVQSCALSASLSRVLRMQCLFL